MLKKKLHHFCNRFSTDDGPKSGRKYWDTYNYWQYINQFPPNTIKVIREFERIQKKICRYKMSTMFNEICIYIYIYIYIWKKIMDSNPTICEEKLTRSNPSRKGGFIKKLSQLTRSVCSTRNDSKSLNEQTERGFCSIFLMSGDVF